MNNLIKFVINTFYGDLISLYFKCGNTVAGNNITARARSMAWHLEKSVHGFQTITDGCCFELNRVIYKHKYNVDSEKLYDPDKKFSGQKNKNITINENRKNGSLVPFYNEDNIAEAVEVHLRELYPQT